MKQSLQLRLGQQLTLTPQLQQAIRLLQLSTLDLKQEIQDALDSNLMLEQEEEYSEVKVDSIADNTGDAESLALDQQNSMPEDLPVDTKWDDIYEPSTYESYSSRGDGDSDEPVALSMASNPGMSLHEHLLDQLSLLSLSDTDRVIAMCIIDEINDEGYLSLSIEQLVEMLDNEEVGAEEVLMMLHMVQSFDPIGVGARDLQECLLLQLKAMPDSTDYAVEAMSLLNNEFEALSKQNLAKIKKHLNLADEELMLVTGLIRSLNPKPGLLISNQSAEYVSPDVFVMRYEGRWHVSLNPETTPKLRINSEYAGLIKRADSSKDNTTLKDHMQEAKWFLKNLMNRNETVLKVASKIVELQRPFFDYGEEAMRPLVLKDIAELLEMHESTISRVTTQKYMHTPRGTFEFKYFFSSHVSTSSGGECSSTAIRALIKKLISEEQPKKPLSDNKLAGLLADQGIQVARRTVAKYREAMAIPPSNERKRLC